MDIKLKGTHGKAKQPPEETRFMKEYQVFMVVYTYYLT